MGHKINHCDSNGTYEDERARAAVEVMFQRRRQCLIAGQVLISPYYTQYQKAPTFTVSCESLEHHTYRKGAPL